MPDRLLREAVAADSLRQGEIIFTWLAAECWQEIAELASSQAYPAATELFQQGSPAREVYFIGRGLVKLIRLDPQGHELIINLRAPGWLLGAASVVVQKSHPVTAVTLTKCHLYRISAQVLLQLAKTDAQFSWQLQQLHSREVFEQAARVMQLGCLSAQQRLEQLLWQLVSAQERNELHKDIRLQLPLKQWEMAQLIAITPPYLSELFNHLERDGILRREKGWFIIPDPQRLWHATDD